MNEREKEKLNYLNIKIILTVNCPIEFLLKHTSFQDRLPFYLDY